MSLFRGTLRLQDSEHQQFRLEAYLLRIKLCRCTHYQIVVGSIAKTLFRKLCSDNALTVDEKNTWVGNSIGAVTRLGAGIQNAQRFYQGAVLVFNNRKTNAASSMKFFRIYLVIIGHCDDINAKRTKLWCVF